MICEDLSLFSLSLLIHLNEKLNTYNILHIFNKNKYKLFLIEVIDIFSKVLMYNLAFLNAYFCMRFDHFLAHFIHNFDCIK